MMKLFHSQCILRQKISRVLISFFWLFSTPAFAISNITVMADESVGIAVAKLARDYARVNQVAVATSFLPKDRQAAQILEGSAADVLITADGKWLAELQTMGLVDIYSKQIFANGRLVLIGARDSSLQMEIHSNFSTAAIINAMGSDPALFIGNPEMVMEGKYAKQSIRSLGVSNALEAYTLYLKSTDEMIEQVTKNQAFAIVNYARALLLNDVRIIDDFPENSHTAMPYYAVAIASDNMDEARRFIKFLTSNIAKNDINRSGLSAMVH